LKITTEAESATRVSIRPFSIAAITLAALAAAGMWLYANKILRAQQIAEAAAHGRPRGNLSDLYPRWLGARELLLRGRDPYGSDITREIQAAYYGRPLDPARPNDPKDQQAFAYPLYVVFVLAPTVRLPFAIVQPGFWCLLVGFTSASVVLWMRALGWRASTASQVIWILLVLGSFPAVQGLKLQQLTLLVAALLAASVMAMVRRRFVLAGIMLAVASIKPQLVLLMAAWLLIWSVGDWRNRGRLIWSFTISIAVLVAGGELLLPGWIREFRQATAAYYQYTGGGQSVLDVLLTPQWGRILAGILLAIAFTFLWQVRRSDERTAEFQWSVAFVLALTLLVIPMSAPYNQLLLLPALMLIVRSLPELWSKNAASRWLVLLASISVSWPWLAALGLVTALAFIPGEAVQRFWAVPLYTSYAIPLTITALLFAGRRQMSKYEVRSEKSEVRRQKYEVRMQK
jgi:hypothetical protein